MTVVAVVAAGVVTGFVSQAQAAGHSPYYNVATGLCLDSNTSKKVYAQSCNGGSFQYWTFDSASRLKNYATGFCLDSNTSKQAYTGSCNSGNFQKWRRYGEQWVDVATGFCLDGNSAGSVYTHDCNTGNNQKWDLYIEPLRVRA